MSGEGSSQVHTKTVVLQYAERCRLLECGGVVADCDSPDRRRKPATVASRCGNPVRHQPVSDRLKCPSVGTLREDPLGDLQRKGWRCSQSLTTGALGRQGISGALTDQPALVLGTRNDDIRRHLASRRASVDVKVGEVQRPALASGSLHQTRTVHNRATQPVHRGHQQSTDLAATHRLQGCKCGGATFQGFRTDALVAVLPDNGQPLALGVSGDGRALGFEPKSGQRLFGCRYAQVGDHRAGRSSGAAVAPPAPRCSPVLRGPASPPRSPIVCGTAVGTPVSRPAQHLQRRGEHCCPDRSQRTRFRSQQ